jgi:hypothetical protein
VLLRAEPVVRQWRGLSGNGVGGDVEHTHSQSGVVQSIRVTARCVQQRVSGRAALVTCRAGTVLA